MAHLVLNLREELSLALTPVSLTLDETRGVSVYYTPDVILTQVI